MRHLIRSITLSSAISLLVVQVSLARPSQTPLDVTFAIEPNVMIIFDTSTSMSFSVNPADGNNPPTGGADTRLTVAKSEVTKLINETDDVRFCLSTFFWVEVPDADDRYGGGHISPMMQCGTNKSTLTTTINSLTATNANPTGTPLASALYDATRYFRGRSAYFGDTPQYTDNPIQYRCQGNSAIVVTDGEASGDWNTSAAPLDYDQHLEDRNINGLTYSFDTNNWDFDVDPIAGGFPDAPAVLDDVALFASQIDLVPPSGGEATLVSTDGANVLANPDPFGNSGKDAADKPYDESADFINTRKLRVSTIGLLLNDPTLEKAAENGNGIYASAGDQAELGRALRAAIGSASSNPNASGAGAALASATLIDNKTNLYISSYNTDEWSGDLLRIILTENPTTNVITPALSWSASSKLNALSSAGTTNTRNIFTHDGINAVDFTTGNVNSTLRTLLDPDFATTGSTESDDLINFIRGDQTNEQVTDANNIVVSGKYRTRSSILGDLVHSRPTYVKDKYFGYPEQSYETYLTSTEVSTRKAMVYIGGNDGILHGFDANDGDEIFGFVPNTVLPDLSKLATPNYQHQYFVDGEMTIIDAKLDPSDLDEWSTVLASPLGAGHKGLFLLNITDPDGSASEIFEWEITSEDADYRAMGHILSSPRVIRVRNSNNQEKWYMVVGNGVHSVDNGGTTNPNNDVIGKAVVYVIDLATGDRVQEITLDPAGSYTKFSNANGVSSVATVDVDSDTFVDRIYAGDLKGNIWRMNYNASANNGNGKFEISHSSGGINQPIFTATNSSGEAQAITAELTVTGPPRASESNEGEMIFFGTGQYFDLAHLLDAENSKTQSMYALWDQGGWNSSSTPINRSNELVEQVIPVNTNPNATERMFDNNPVNYAGGKLGWYMDLPDYGERIVRKASGLFEHIGFFSQSPVSQIDPCLIGANSWSMIAKRDNALELEVKDINGNVSLLGGTKQTQENVQDPIFVQLSNGELVAPVVNTTTNPPTVTTPYRIQKTYDQAAWKRIFN